MAEWQACCGAAQSQWGDRDLFKDASERRQEQSSREGRVKDAGPAGAALDVRRGPSVRGWT